MVDCEQILFFIRKCFLNTFNFMTCLHAKYVNIRLEYIYIFHV